MAFSSGVDDSLSPDKMELPKFQHWEAKQMTGADHEVEGQDDQERNFAQPALKQHQDVFFNQPQVQLPHRLNDNGEHFNSILSDEEPCMSDSQEQSSQAREPAEVESSVDDLSKLAKLLEQNTASAIVGHEHE